MKAIGWFFLFLAAGILISLCVVLAMTKLSSSS